jgi:hypothetical protein
MRRQRWMGVFALALGIGLGGGMSDARSQIMDLGKYPDIAGRWKRSEVCQWARGEKPPLTPEYQAILESNIAERATGGQGFDAMYRCFPPGMPRQMHVYAPMEIVITPKTTYILIDHIHDDRRIYTDGPEEDIDPVFSGHSIGKWLDEDGDLRAISAGQESVNPGRLDVSRLQHSATIVLLTKFGASGIIGIGYMLPEK